MLSTPNNKISNGVGSPSKSLFPGQQQNEQIYLVTRNHWVVLGKEIAVWTLFAIFPLVFDGYIVVHFPVFGYDAVRQIVNLFKTVYLMLLIASLFSIWIIYYLNYQIITNERIVDVTQKNLLHHTTSEVNINRIQDVTSEVRGFLGNLFNYGNVYVQTAGETANFQFDMVPNPHAVQKLILDLYEQLPAAEKAPKE